MKPKFCIYPQPSYLTFRTAIEAVHAVRQSRTSRQILFAVCVTKKQALTGGKGLACEDKCSKKIGAISVQQADRRSFEARAVPILVYFYILCNNKSYKKASGFLRAMCLHRPLSNNFEDRSGRQCEHIKYIPYGRLWTYKSKTAKLFLTTYNNFLAK
ncbi:hypothetical protein J2Z29_001496 [Treponema pedis]